MLPNTYLEGEVLVDLTCIETWALSSECLPGSDGAPSSNNCRIDGKLWLVSLPHARRLSTGLKISQDEVDECAYFRTPGGTFLRLRERVSQLVVIVDIASTREDRGRRNDGHRGLRVWDCDRDADLL